MPEWDQEMIDEDGNAAWEEAVLDVVTSDPATGHTLHLDVTVTTACPADLAALHQRARRDGRGAADAAAEKRRRYRLAGASLVPVAFEDGERPAEETIAFVRRCGAALDRRETWGGDAGGQPVVAQLWQGLSTLLQWGNADMILSANGG